MAAQWLITFLECVSQSGCVLWIDNFEQLPLYRSIPLSLSRSTYLMAHSTATENTTI